MTEREIEILNMLGELYDYWKNHPELRLGQIMVNLNPFGADSFYVQDSHYLAALGRANKKGGTNV